MSLTNKDSNKYETFENFNLDFTTTFLCSKSEYWNCEFQDLLKEMFKYLLKTILFYCL